MEVSTIEVAGSEALTQLESLRSDYGKSGKYPFLIGDSEELERLIEAESFHNESTDEIVGRSLMIDADDFFKLRERQSQEMYEEANDVAFRFDRDQLFGQWKGEAHEKHSILLHKDIVTGKIKDWVYIGLVAVDEPWAVPAVTKYGGWNECPHPDEHCAVMRHWREKWGAEILGMSGDVIECVVFQPPSSKESAIELAWEQYWYCQDIVDQGTQTVCDLASTLLNARYWFFWWD